jgi:hypothetical protein
MQNRSLFAVKIPSWLYPRWWEVAYIILGPDGWLRDELVKVAETRLNPEFEEFLTSNITAYINEGKQPDREIEAAILNLADDVMAGRKMVIRTGDYITLQGHFQNLGKTQMK